MARDPRENGVRAGGRLRANAEGDRGVVAEVEPRGVHLMVDVSLGMHVQQTRGGSGV